MGTEFSALRTIGNIQQAQPQLDHFYHHLPSSV
jgi:hypothetical protein